MSGRNTGSATAVTRSREFRHKGRSTAPAFRAGRTCGSDAPMLPISARSGIVPLGKARGGAMGGHPDEEEDWRDRDQAARERPPWEEEAEPDRPPWIGG